MGMLKLQLDFGSHFEMRFPIFQLRLSVDQQKTNRMKIVANPCSLLANLQALPNYELEIRDDGYEDLERWRVGTFYPTEWGGAVVGVSLVMAVTLAFGITHLIGWSSTFPSNTERTLWRAASACITGVPFVVFATRTFHAPR
jgi:hypothetical protein